MGCGISAMVWCRAWCLVRAASVQMAALAGMWLCINLASIERLIGGRVAKVSGTGNDSRGVGIGVVVLSGWVCGMAGSGVVVGGNDSISTNGRGQFCLPGWWLS